MTTSPDSPATPSPVLPPRFGKGTLLEAGALMIIAALLAVVAFFANPSSPGFEEGRLEAGEVTLQRLPAAMEAILWIDARTEAQYEEEHIPGAVLVNEDDWEAGLMRFFEVWDPEHTVIVYCDAADCHSSRALAARLERELGPDVGTVYHLHGGWVAWRKTQTPTTAP